MGTTWLLPLRNEFRRVLSESSTAIHCARLLGDGGELIPIYIWLLSNFADRTRLLGIDRFCNHHSPIVRKHVAKTLRRLEAWQQLDTMAKAYPSDQTIQWFAYAPTTKRKFFERLQRFKVHLDDSHMSEVGTASKMSYWSLFTPWQGKPPKDAALIRRILLRIRRWVRGSE
jgi:hypothetical protein